MKGLIQRVSSAAVTVDREEVARIGHGILLLLGLEKQDTQRQAVRLLEKVLAYRIFADARQHMNLDLRQTEGALLVVSQFTLAADTRKGLRPSFSSAMPPGDAEALYEFFLREARARHDPVASGRFGAMMDVSLVNAGPVTFLLES